MYTKQNTELKQKDSTKKACTLGDVPYNQAQIYQKIPKLNQP